MTLERGAGIALWRQIQASVEGEIRSGRRAPGSRLPTEGEFATRFGVNRHTIRRAMEELERQGLIRIEQGRGSFVAEDVVDYPLGPRTRFSEIIRAQKREPAGRILRAELVPAEGRVAELLGVRGGTRLVQVVRVSLADGRPVALGTHHFPAARFAALPKHLAEDPSITRAMALCGVSDYRRRVTRITARMPNPEEAEALAQPRARPVLITESVNEDAEGKAVDASVTLYASNRTQLVVEGTGR
jgi:GntR family phosphonate transport system transcriptional regulator